MNLLNKPARIPLLTHIVKLARWLSQNNNRSILGIHQIRIWPHIQWTWSIWFGSLSENYILDPDPARSGGYDGSGLDPYLKIMGPVLIRSHQIRIFWIWIKPDLVDMMDPVWIPI